MLTRARVREWLEERFYLRIHMTLILGGTFLAGLIATRLLMEAGVNRLALRYVIAVGAAVLCFSDPGPALARVRRLGRRVALRPRR